MDGTSRRHYCHLHRCKMGRCRSRRSRRYRFRRFSIRFRYATGCASRQRAAHHHSRHYLRLDFAGLRRLGFLGEHRRKALKEKSQEHHFHGPAGLLPLYTLLRNRICGFLGLSRDCRSCYRSQSASRTSPDNVRDRCSIRHHRLSDVGSNRCHDCPLGG